MVNALRLQMFFKHISKYGSLLSYTGLMRMIETPSHISFPSSFSMCVCMCIVCVYASIFHALNQMKCMFSINFPHRRHRRRYYRSYSAIPSTKIPNTRDSTVVWRISRNCQRRKRVQLLIRTNSIREWCRVLKERATHRESL